MSGYLVGLVGADVAGSLSPALFEAEADRLAIRLLYRTIDISAVGDSAENLRELLRYAAAMGFSGLNITHPCKQSIVPHLDAVSVEAAALDAVNTVVFTDAGAIGHNTDGTGFAESFAAGLPGTRLDRVALFGAGGAGAAVGHALLGMGTGHLTVVDVDVGRAEQLVARLNGQFDGRRASTGEAAVAADTDGVVNATPIGMHGHPGTAVPVTALRQHMWVVDIVYRPRETALLRHARDIGCRTLGGGGMLVYQATHGFRLLTGRQPDPARMLEHFRSLTDRRAE
jgi:shikimate dehydrogenase